MPNHKKNIINVGESLLRSQTHKYLAKQNVASEKFTLLKIIQDVASKEKISIYLVGGFLRDQFLNRTGCDFDFTVSKNAISLARKLSRILKGAFVLLDEEHPAARVVKREGNTLWTFDFSDFRASSLEKDLALRDFTINTLCVDLSGTDKILDYQKAMTDLKSKTVRMVAPRAFVDDPLRLMRAFSLFAQLGFKIESKTFKQIQKDAKRIHDVSIERTREELFKVLASPRACETMILMDKAGLLEEVIPQLNVMKGVFQGGYHHLNVWEHSLEVVKQLEELVTEIKQPFIQDYLQEEIGGGHKRLSLIKFACLLHDIGKPDTKKKEGTRMSFHGHEHVGADITRIVAKALKVSVKERYFLEDAVRMHLRPGYLSNFKTPSKRMVFRFLREAKDEALSILLLALADQRATRGKLTTKAKHEHHRKICWQTIDQFIELKNQKPVVRLLTGHDLIKKLKLKPSPLFTKILNEVQESVALGKISTKDEALTLARKIAKV